MQPPLIDPILAAEFIVKRLYRPLSLGDADCLAASETEHPFAGDKWFWTDDNAKIVEFLARPELGRRYAGEAAAILRFVRLMCRGPFILRRVSEPRLLVTGQDGSETSYYHSLLHLRSDLSRGLVMAGLRFHDNRTADNLLLHTNCVEFSHKGRKYSLPVEPAIDDVASKLDGHRLELRFAGDLRFKPRWRDVRVGRFSYVYRLDDRSMVIDVEAALDVDPSADIDDIVLTIAHDYLSHGGNDVHYSRVYAQAAGREALRFAAGDTGRQFLPAAGAEYYSIVQSEMAGFALAVHSMPREPARLSDIEVLVRYPGYLHLARARYRFAGPSRGRRLVAAEHKMLTGGGLYDRVADYAQLLRDAAATGSTQGNAVDFSVSYDYGAELNAFAQYFAFTVADGSTAPAAAEAKSLFDFYLDAYFEAFVGGHYRKEHTIFSRQIAFVILSLITMYRATGSDAYRARLGQLCEILLEFESCFPDVAGDPASGFVMGTGISRRAVFVDCHSAALLALARAACYVDDSRIPAAIDRGLGCFCLETARIEWHDGPHRVDVVGVDWVDDNGTRQRNIGFWNFHAGLMLRFFAALGGSTNPALQAVAARHRDRIELFEMIIRRQIEHSLTRYDDAVEIRCSTLSGETNSETQPWAALGLLERAAV